MQYDRNEIAEYIKRKERYVPADRLEAMIDREIALRKHEKFEYNFLAVANIVLFVSFVGFLITAIVFIFKGNWPYMLGFGVLSYICLFIFRRIPYPQTRTEKAFGDLRRALSRYR